MQIEKRDNGMGEENYEVSWAVSVKMKVVLVIICTLHDIYNAVQDCISNANERRGDINSLIDSNLDKRKIERGKN